MDLFPKISFEFNHEWSSEEDEGEEKLNPSEHTSRFVSVSSAELNDLEKSNIQSDQKAESAVPVKRQSTMQSPETYFTGCTINGNVQINVYKEYNQINAISLACKTGVEGCKELTTGWFREWMKDPAVNNINPNLKYTVYCSAIAAGGVDEWDFAWSMYKNATIASEADKLMSALSCTKQPWLLNRYLEYCLDPKMIRKQDVTSTISSIASNPIGQPLAWDFLRAKWDYIYNDYGGDSFPFHKLINGVTQRFSSKSEYNQLLQFKEDNAGQLGSAAASFDQALERTKANINWVAMNKEQVLNWFTSEASSPE